MLQIVCNSELICSWWEAWKQFPKLPSVTHCLKVSLCFCRRHLSSFKLTSVSLGLTNCSYVVPVQTGTWHCFFNVKLRLGWVSFQPELFSSFHFLLCKNILYNILFLFFLQALLIILQVQALLFSFCSIWKRALKDGITFRKDIWQKKFLFSQQHSRLSLFWLNNLQIFFPLYNIKE